MVLRGERHEGALEKALTEYSEGNYASALSTLTNAIKQFGERSSLVYWTGCSAFKQGDFDFALQYFKRYCILEPEKAEGCRWVADIYLKQHKYPLAMMWYEKALKIDPKDAQAQKGLKDAREATDLQGTTTETVPTVPPVTSTPKIDKKPASETNSPSGAPPTQVPDQFWQRVWSLGLVDYIDAAYRVWGHIGGVFFMGMILMRITTGLMQKYRLPLDNSELPIIWWSNILCGALYGVLVWGTSSKLRLILAGIALLLIAGFHLQLARAASIQAAKQHVAKGFLSYLARKFDEDSRNK
jgi:tetratricopeptide (TPR) repeat protein